MESRENDENKLSKKSSTSATVALPPYTGNLSSWPGPRTVSLQRNEHGFGFTLRHFIVYPPESLKDANNVWAESHEAKLRPLFNNMEPMDTIFVKSVKESGPADRAGLATGDRIVSVNGETIRGKSYSQVVQLIQKSDNNLQLLVVPKEDDILQLYFSGTAYHPGIEDEPYTTATTFRRPSHTIFTSSGSSSTSSLDTLHRWPSAIDSSGQRSPLRFRAMKNQSSLPCNVDYDSQANRRPVLNQQPCYRSCDSSSDLRPSLPMYKCQMDPQGHSRSSGDLSPPRFTHFGSGDFHAQPTSADGLPSFQMTNNTQLLVNNDPYFIGNENLQPRYFSSYGGQPQQDIYGVNLPLTAITNNNRAPLVPQYPIYHNPKSEYFLSNTSATIDKPSDGYLSSRERFFRSCGISNPSSREPSSERNQDPIRDRMKGSLEKKAEFLFSQPVQDNSPLSIQRAPQPVNKVVTGKEVSFCVSDALNAPYGSGSNSNSLDGSGSHSDESLMSRLGKPFVSKLDRIQESHMNGVSLSESPVKSVSNLSSPKKAVVTPLRKANSLDSDVSHSNNHLGSEDLQMQRVSQRAKLFESGSIESESRNRLNFYRNELSRLTSKGQTMTVSARAAQFESLSTSQETVSSESEASLIPRHKISLEAKKESKELRWQRSQSDNVTPGHSTTTAPKSTMTNTPSSDPLPAEVMPSTTSEPAFIDEDDEDDMPNRRKAVRQNSYLQAVRSPYREPNDFNCRVYLNGRIPSHENYLSVPNHHHHYHHHNHHHPLSCESSSAPSLHYGSNGFAAYSPSATNEHQSFLHGSESSPLLEEGSISRLIAAYDKMLEGNNPANSKMTIVTSAPTSTPVPISDQVSIAGIVLRTKPIFEDENQQSARRVSYLKATSAERMHGESDEEANSLLTDSKTPPAASHRTQSILKLKAFFGEKTPQIVEATEVKELPSPVYDVVKEGWLNCKTAFLEGKRATDRSWKQLWGCLRGSTVYLFKDKKDSHQLPLCLEEQPIVVKPSSADIAHDYTKKKNVFRLMTTNGSEYLLQAEDHEDMLHWIKLIQENHPFNSMEGQSCKSDQLSRLSPQLMQKGIKKLTSFRNRSPTGQSPLIKVKKIIHGGDDIPPKPKTWRGKMAKTIKKIHGTASTTTPAEGVTINVPLEECPPSSISEYVPLIVELCTSIVEARGLEMVGIYRVPGNTAAVTALLDAVNKGFEALNLQDARWNDVNVISSVLKAFFRKLPEPLVTAELYPCFIEANKIEDVLQRMCTVKKLLHELPEHHYETLKHLIRHLQKVALHSSMNKMEARNLAIVFGPTLVRATDDNMVTMVTDMSHQCCIVEMLISKADWFFNEEDSDDIINQNVPESFVFTSDQQSNNQTSSNQNLLLNNISKMEDVYKPREITARDIVTSIINAANRKVRQRAKKQSVCSVPGLSEDAGFEERDIDREVELRRQRVQKHQDSIDSSGARPGSADTRLQRTLSRDLLPTKRTISADSLNSLHMTSNSSLADSISRDQAELFYLTREGERIPISHEPMVVSSDKLGDEVVFRTYAGLSASTQERIRRFEMETRALLQRNLNRQCRENERRQVERRRIEMEWQRAKQELEQENLLDDFPDCLGADAGKNENGVTSSTKGQGDVKRLFTDYPTVNVLRDPRPSIHSQSSSSDYSSNTSPIVHHRDHYSCQGPQTNILITSDYNSNTSSPLSTGSSDVKVPAGSTLSQFPSIHKSRITFDLQPSSQVKTDSAIMMTLDSGVHLRRGSSAESIGASTTMKSQPTIPGTGIDTNSTGRAGAVSKLQNVRLSSIRCGSLDSLREYYDRETSTTGSVEEGGDLMKSITSSLDQKLRGILDPNTRKVPAVVTEPPIKPEVPINPETTVSTTPQAERKRRYRDPSLHRTRDSPGEKQQSPSLEKKASATVKPIVTKAVDNRHNVHRNCCSACPYLRNEAAKNNSKNDSKSKSHTCVHSTPPPQTMSRQSSNESNVEIETHRKENTLITATVSTTKHTVTTTVAPTSVINATIISKSEKTKSNLKDKANANKRGTSASSAPSSKGDSKENTAKCPAKEKDCVPEKQILPERSTATAMAMAASQCKNVVNQRNVRRRHTVGGTKDFENFRVLLGGFGRKETQLSAWERLQPVVQKEQRSMKSWLERERLRTSSPDLSPQKSEGKMSLTVSSGDFKDTAEISRLQQRRISFPDIRMTGLQFGKVIALESQV